MRVEVDQSGKVEKTNKDTVIAFSNLEQSTVLVSSKVKQILMRDKKDKRYKIRLFAAGVYLLLKDKLRDMEIIMIDEEYPGYNRYIKDLLLTFIRKEIPNFDKSLIKFGRITKESNAHNIALLTYRGILKPNKIIREEELSELLG